MDGDYSDKFLDLGVQCLPTNEQPLQGPLLKNISNRVRPLKKGPPSPPFRDLERLHPATDVLQQWPCRGCSFVGRHSTPESRNSSL